MNFFFVTNEVDKWGYHLQFMVKKLELRNEKYILQMQLTFSIAIDFGANLYPSNPLSVATLEFLVS